MKTIMVKHYVFNCEDIKCDGVSCVDCPLYNNSPLRKTGYGDSDCAFIAENNINDFISQFDEIKLTIKPRKE